jgi:hypothetical protein
MKDIKSAEATAQTPETEARAVWEEPVLSRLSLKETAANANNGADMYAKS